MSLGYARGWILIYLVSGLNVYWNVFELHVLRARLMLVLDLVQTLYESSVQPFQHRLARQHR